MRLRAFLFAMLLALCATQARAICNSKFLNPVSDICWDCIFPISIGAISMGGAGRPDTDNQAIPFCVCPGVVPRPGLAIGLWEPARLVDVANEAGCFVNMGFEVDFGLLSLGKSSATRRNGGRTGSKWQAHYYSYPLISWLGVVVDGLCVQNTQFDITYISEIDPLWQSAELNNLLNPEAILFANPIAQAACAADCVRASSGMLPFDKLFWCTGCGGSIYPIQGNVVADVGGVMASQIISTKMVARMHRLLLARRTADDVALCTSKSQPVINKSQYRMQITRPVPKTSGRYGCGPIGFSPQYVDRLREFPYKGESFGWLLWRKRNCCAL
ncbi:conjugal transfer pilus assembly protein TraU [uncultured Tateyamaria sp.]|uniref:conjugal transfer pilus assembly protein TraU n=1 Tax=uncultured Tateyamaria sp. TaxID=455651 RepID=UPI00260D1B22|nr:conjugal transfer pilus assembly protein TraU [uncultured Tateyamaria sp.]